MGSLRSATGLRSRNLSKTQKLLETAVDEDAAAHRQSPWTPMQSSMSVQVTPRKLFSGRGETAGPKRITLSDPGLLTKLCCFIPGLLFFPSLLIVITTAIFWQQAFYVITGAFSLFTLAYSTNVTISCALGARKMRQAAREDWHSLLKQKQCESPASSEVMHIVVVPNYKEDEDLLLDTVQHLAKSALAKESIWVVLAMEEREGKAAREKAERLIGKASHLFADMFATFHPVGLPGDVAGKSSNDQWAYSKALQRLAPKIAKMDSSQVFISCMDADTLFHPQYFSALSYQGLCLPREERVWTIWQPPVMMTRNLFSSPMPTRVTAYATVVFELGGLAGQRVARHFAYSSYSFTLALSMHHRVGGWDRDVIAEDWHMFVKCYFASIWEQLEALETGTSSTSTEEGQKQGVKESVKSRMQVQPVYLPATGYLVESDDGWFASLRAKYVQSRRHSQGLAELSYLILQQVHLLRSERAGNVSWAAHWDTLRIAAKMATLHFFAHFQAMGVVMPLAMFLPGIARWALSMGIQELLQACLTRSVETLFSLRSFEGFHWAMCTIFGTVPLMSISMTATTYIVLRDVLSGKLTADVADPKAEDASASTVPDTRRSAGDQQGLSWWRRLQLINMVQFDYLGAAWITMFFFGIIPATQAAWSLMWWKGSGFQYVAAARPGAAD